MQVGMPKDQGLYYKPSAAVHAGVLAASTLPQYNTIQYFLGGKGGRCVGLTTLAPSCAVCLEILGASAYWSSKGLPRPVIG